MSTEQNTTTKLTDTVNNLVGPHRTSALVTAIVTSVFMCGVVLGICANPEMATSPTGRTGVSSMESTAVASSAPETEGKDGSDASSAGESENTAGSTSTQDSDSAHPDAGGGGSNAGSAREETDADNNAVGGEGAATSRGDVLEEVDAATLEELVRLLGEPAANSLAALATTNPDAAWIVTHLGAYAVFRDHIRAKALTLAAEEPLACAYVRGMPEASPSDTPDYAAQAADAQGTSPTMPKSPFPHLYQWDQRWGYTYYDGDDFGMSGCGPCAIAIVYAGLTGKDDMDPYRMGQLALEGGFVAPDYGGTSDGYFTWVAERLGLTCRTIDVSADSIRSTLEAGSPIIAHVGPGTFTRVGHYFVLAGIAEDGSIIINDPYSAQRSAKLWDASAIANEALVLYAYTAV